MPLETSYRATGDAYDAVLAYSVTDESEKTLVLAQGEDLIYMTAEQAADLVKALVDLLGENKG